MKLYKKSDNVEFDVIYADGTRKRVKEGILFEACEDNSTELHVGTSRTSVIRAYFEAAIEWMNNIQKVAERYNAKGE